MSHQSEQLNPVDKGYLHGVAAGIAYARDALDDPAKAFTAGLILGRVLVNLPQTEAETEYYYKLIQKWSNDAS